jgi:rare lipoprotein A
MRSLTYPLIYLLPALLLAACSTSPYNTSPNGRYSQHHDSAPVNPPDISQLQEPVPHPEPRSRYGNPSSYEVNGVTYHVLENAQGYDQTGYASWYGNKFQGYRTSSGEPYDMYKFTAANKVLPLPTYARVTNLDNGRSVIVRVNDRGPFHPGRIIDLSWAAAKRLGVLANGTAKVRVVALTPGINPPAAPAPAPLTSAIPASATPAIAAAASITPVSATTAIPAPSLYLQLGAFSSANGASNLQQQLLAITGLPPLALVQKNQLYKLWLGPFKTDAERQQTRQLLQQKGFNSIPVHNP